MTGIFHVFRNFDANTLFFFSLYTLLLYFPPFDTSEDFLSFFS